MALGNSAISTVREAVSGVLQGQSDIMNETVSIEYAMSNEDFVKFASDSTFGSSSQEKLKRAMDGLKQLDEAVQNLKSKTESFCQEQEELNNRSV